MRWEEWNNSGTSVVEISWCFDYATFDRVTHRNSFLFVSDLWFVFIDLQIVKIDELLAPIYSTSVAQAIITVAEVINLLVALLLVKYALGNRRFARIYWHLLVIVFHAGPLLVQSRVYVGVGSGFLFLVLIPVLGKQTVLFIARSVELDLADGGQANVFIGLIITGKQLPLCVCCFAGAFQVFVVVFLEKGVDALNTVDGILLLVFLGSWANWRSLLAEILFASGGNH